jgi:Trk K+ transport system NAD-binding subunit
MEKPIVLCGLGRVGWRVLEYLRAAGLPVVAVDNVCTPDDPRLAGVRLVRGDCRRREVLEQAGVAAARGVLVITSTELVNIATAMQVRNLAPDVRIVIRMFNQNLISRLGHAVRNIVALSASALAAPIMAVTALTGQGLGAFSVERAHWQVAEVTIGAGTPLAGRTIADLMNLHDAQVVAHFPATGEPRFLLDVDPAAALQPGDRLIVCIDPLALPKLLGQARDSEVRVHRWLGDARRWCRVAWRTLGEIDLPVKLATGVLVGVVLLGIFVFESLEPNISVPEALYRTIRTMATMADPRLGDEESPLLKVFVSGLRITGAALLGVFTAILTNYLLRARLRGTLEIRRVPDRGHVIVVGLGNIGYRVVEELIGYGERVVVLEVAPDGRFVSTARRLGAAVIHGDATVREVLRQANAGTARAVVAATSNDLANLEVALLVRELNETQRVVLRLSDPDLARTLREAANVRLALSVPTLAGPAFVAALFGDRVLTVLLVGGHMLAVVDVLVQPEDAHLIGQTLRAVAVDYRLLPVAHLGPGCKPERASLNGRLSAGSRLVAIIALGDLERFVRRERVAADCAVEVSAFTLPARDWVALVLRTQQGLSAEAADEALKCLPVCVGRNLTRGQAEDLLVQLHRERVTAHLRPNGSTG